MLTLLPLIVSYANCVVIAAVKPGDSVDAINHANKGDEEQVNVTKKRDIGD